MASEQTPKRRGRPKSSVPHSAVTVWVPTGQHDRFIQLARDRRESVSAVVRKLISLRLDGRRG